MIKIILACVFFILASGCSSCVKYPEKPYDPKRQKWLSPQECWDWNKCEYYKAKRKRGDCKAEFEACYKARIYKKCSDPKIRYSKHSFDACWHILK